jgi:hypothetical protein
MQFSQFFAVIFALGVFALTSRETAQAQRLADLRPGEAVDIRSGWSCRDDRAARPH